MNPTQANLLSILPRLLIEGYGKDAWHGPDMQTALADVSPHCAFWRPAPQRHNIAEVAAHHAFYIRTVDERLSGKPADAFPLTGDGDWFVLDAGTSPTWPTIESLVRGQQAQLVLLVEEIAAGRQLAALAPTECFDQVLGITCHAIYHAGQIQLLKRLYPA